MKQFTFIHYCIVLMNTEFLCILPITRCPCRKITLLVLATISTASPILTFQGQTVTRVLSFQFDVNV